MGRLASTTVRIGETAPPLALFTLDERLLMLADLLQETAVLLVFAPGSWSPNTRRQIQELSATHELFSSMGLAVVMAVTQDARSLRRRLATSMPPFTVLADERGEAARDYGVYRALSWDGLSVTRPAAFAIDQTGCIRFIYVGASHHDVPETEALLLLALWLFGKGTLEEPTIGEEAAEEIDQLAEIEPPAETDTLAEADVEPFPEAETVTEEATSAEPLAPAEVDAGPPLPTTPDGQTPTAPVAVAAESGAVAGVAASVEAQPLATSAGAAGIDPGPEDDQRATAAETDGAAEVATAAAERAAELPRP